MRHIALERLKDSVEIDDDSYVVFRIVEQTHRGTDFAVEEGDRRVKSFRASNRVIIESAEFPAATEKCLLNARGAGASHDNGPLTCPEDWWPGYKLAVEEYNATNGGETRVQQPEPPESAPWAVERVE